MKQYIEEINNKFKKCCLDSVKFNKNFEDKKTRFYNPLYDSSNGYYRLGYK